MSEFGAALRWQFLSARRRQLMADMKLAMSQGRPIDAAKILSEARETCDDLDQLEFDLGCPEFVLAQGGSE